MGEELHRAVFTERDFAQFKDRLEAETAQLALCLERGECAATGYVTGFELEAWLIDYAHFPAPINEAYLERLASPLVVPELSRFNVELNGTPRALRGDALSRMERELHETWQTCLRVARELGSTMILIGTLPTIRQSDLCLANISPLKRYRALNEQVLAARDGAPIRVRVDGRESLDLEHGDVMLEAATTSFQVHLQVPADEMVRHFNASLVLSAPLVAASANSPFLFGRDLWDETRIPVFEQAVEIGDDPPPALRRVTFGSAYLQSSAIETFRENLERYPVLLPQIVEEPGGGLPHLRLHNGTIWRWNRPLIGFDDAGVPHLRIEHRVMPAGPTIADMMANAALYLGAAHFLAKRRTPAESELPFAETCANFYRAARTGLRSRLRWLDGAEIDAATLLLEAVIPMAHEGLRSLGIDDADRYRYLDLVTARVRSGQNGAAWQRAFASAHGRDFFRLSARYLENQRSGMPVHEWEV